MRKTLSVIGTFLGLLLSCPVLSSAQTPEAVIELSGGSVAAGVGYSWGHGTLVFHGKRYPVTVSGLSLASVGAAGYTATGSVSNLTSPQDIDGVYTAVAAAGTLGGGRGATAMRNQNGVAIEMTSTTEGLNLTVAAEGVKIALANGARWPRVQSAWPRSDELRGTRRCPHSLPCQATSVGMPATLISETASVS